MKLNAKNDGETIPHYAADGQSFSKMDVTVFGGNIQRYQDIVSRGGTLLGEQGALIIGNIRQGNKSGVIASVAAHEIVHATDPKNMKDNFSNQRHKTHMDIESKPEARETEILKKGLVKSVVSQVLSQGF